LDRISLAKIVNEIVEVCVFRVRGNRPQYLLLQRSAGEELYPNLWQIITGTMNEKESSIGAALRELREETKLPLKRLWTVPFVNSFYDPSKDCVHLIPVFAVEVDAAREPQLSREHRRYEWLSYPAARRRLVWPGQRQGLIIVHDFIAGKKKNAALVEIHHP
jgi:8-oxo-dGTP pyrophosphatase MutT (NUDIX family)